MINLYFLAWWQKELVPHHIISGLNVMISQLLRLVESSRYAQWTPNTEGSTIELGLTYEISELVYNTSLMCLNYRAI